MRGLIPPGHKVATRAIAVGRAGAALQPNHWLCPAKPLRPGEHVHTHNLNMGRRAKATLQRDYAIGQDVKPEAARQQAQLHGHTSGLRRPRGHTQLHRCAVQRELLGHRCARHCRPFFADATTLPALANFPNVDGVIALTHGTGCGMDTEGLGIQSARAHPGRLRHPRQLSGAWWWWAWVARPTSSAPGWRTAACAWARRCKVFNIQDSGGTRLTVEKGIALIEEHAAPGQRHQP